MRKRNRNNQKRLCLVCNKHYYETINKYEICPICGWEDDPVQISDPDFTGGPIE